MEPAAQRWSLRRRLALSVYLLLLIASHLWIATRPSQAGRAPEGSARVSLGASSALQWKAAPATAAPARAGDRVPVLLLHGSPGEASDLTHLAERISSTGREVLSLDLPGFGDSVSAPGGRSIRSQAQSALASLSWREFHIAAWSMGGGVALHMAELAPERVRSLSLIASIGVQEAEGSGSYAFEHFKYGLLWLFAVPLAELVPHFGLLGERAARVGFCRNFLESDQRPLRSILARLSTPILIAHGRGDFLVPLWCAEVSHELARASRLVVFDASHFLVFEPPFGQLDLLAPELEGFLARHDVAGVLEPRARLDFAEEEPRALPEPYRLPRQVPWWLAFSVLSLFARWRPLWCGLAIGVLCALLQLDLGLGLAAALLGASWRALRTPAGWPKPWLLDLARIVGGCVLASVFAVWASPRLCGLAGPWGGTLLTLALPILAALATGFVARRRNPQVA